MKFVRNSTYNIFCEAGILRDDHNSRLDRQQPAWENRLVSAPRSITFPHDFISMSGMRCAGVCLWVVYLVIPVPSIPLLTPLPSSKLGIICQVCLSIYDDHPRSLSLTVTNMKGVDRRIGPRVRLFHAWYVIDHPITLLDPSLFDSFYALRLWLREFFSSSIRTARTLTATIISERVIRLTRILHGKSKTEKGSCEHRWLKDNSQ